REGGIMDVGVVWWWGVQCGVSEIAKRAKAIIYRHKNDPFFRQGSPVIGASRARSARQRAAVNPYHDRTLFARLGRSPHVETETIFALIARRRVIDRALRVRLLPAIRPEEIGRAHV